MALTIRSEYITSEVRFPFRTPNAAATVKTIIEDLSALEKEIDTSEVDAVITELSTGGIFFGRNTRPCLQIKLRNSKVKELTDFGCVIMPQEFGNLVYLVKYEYLGGVGSIFLQGKNERIASIKKKLNTLDKWMEYTFIQTLGDYIFVEMLRKYDPHFATNIDAFRTFFTVE